MDCVFKELPPMESLKTGSAVASKHSIEQNPPKPPMIPDPQRNYLKGQTFL